MAQGNTDAYQTFNQDPTVTLDVVTTTSDGDVAVELLPSAPQARRFALSAHWGKLSVFLVLVAAGVILAVSFTQSSEEDSITVDFGTAVGSHGAVVSGNALASKAGECSFLRMRMRSDMGAIFLCIRRL